MSVITPRLDTSLPTTPSHEWAKDTMRTALPSDGTSQLQSNNPYFNSSSTPSNYPVQQDQPIQTTTNAVPHVTNPYAPASSTSTPGNDVPGSYPREPETAASANYSPSQILNSAKQYIPDPNAAQSVLLTAGQTAKAYLPTTVTEYLSGTQKTSLPSTETQGIQPGEHQDGVGALPGTRDEAGVAKLPEEQSSQTSTERPGLHWQDSEGVGEWGQGGLHKGDERVVDKGLESVSTGVGTAGSADDSKQSFGSDTGIKYKGIQIEKLPESDARWGEMKQPAPAPALPEKAEHKSTPSKDETSAAIARAEEKKAAAEARSSKSSSSSDDTTKPSTGDKGPSVKGSGYDTDYHPAAEHPPPADMDTAVPSTTEADTVGGHGHQKGSTEKTQASSDPDPNTGESAVKEAAGGGPGSGRHDTEENQKHKVGVMSKVKGEVQVLVGKVTKNSDKVDEGRKLKEGRN